ncbi:sphingomyelin synthase-related protein 1 isoform X2 [Octopus sinensis]|nr:sphingomyelin synthase-related protein 1 isoform X2 [Octopus sinensis]XP_036354889.1 sphingomyelin synthase-related protein 1 isoform X2 [Octopus sinensis]
MDVAKWNCVQVADWLTQNGFGDYVYLLTETHRIDGQVLLTLSENDLKQEPIAIPVLGDIKRLMLHVQHLQVTAGNSLSNCNHSYVRKVESSRMTVRRRNLPSPVESQSDTSLFEDCDEVSGAQSQHLDPEIWKTVLSFFYIFTVFLITSFVMVIVHERVPDMRKYPPLPDIFLDNMPYVPWAFEVCEMIGIILVSMWCAVLFFHKHRFILMRRMFSLMGTVFLLRCVTMLITSLSVPGVHLQCEAKDNDIWAKLTRTLEIATGFGMTLQGVRTCGDYMFSGHTVCITMLNFFISEYTSRQRFYYIHTITWVLNLFGIFFILAAHEHYSIDVFIAFYITTRLFLYYHTLANNRALMQRDSKRTKIWFPLFSFFESKCDGIVPNEYEWPLSWPKFLRENFKK